MTARLRAPGLTRAGLFLVLGTLFCAAIIIAAVNDAPVLSGLDGTPTFTEGGAAVVLDANATITDPELTGGSYQGATLTLARSGGASAQARPPILRPPPGRFSTTIGWPSCF